MSRMALFDLVLRLWPERERTEFGPSMRDMFERRVAATRGSSLGRCWRGVRELSSLAWQGIAARTRGGRPSGGAPGGDFQGGRGGGAWGMDLRYALRAIARRPQYSLLVSATLALGLGLAVSAFEVFESALLRPLPFAEGERLVSLWTTREGTPTRGGDMSWLDLADLRASAENLAAMGGHTVPSVAGLAGTDRPSLTSVTAVTPGFFETLGLRPERGRLFESGDHDAGGVALISHNAWLDRFGADPEVIGRVVTLDDRPVRIVGILPTEARYYPDPDIAFWLPYTPGQQSRGSRNLKVIGRLARADALTAATTEIRSLTAALEEAYPESNKAISAVVRPLADTVVGAEIPGVLRLLLVATLAVLLLAAANAAGLVLARGQERAPELAVLASMGASRLRLLRPLFLEGLLLSGAGGVAAVAIARWLPGVVLAHAPITMPRAVEVGLDGRVLAVAGLGTLVVACVAAVLPAWSVAGRSLRASIGAARGSFLSSGTLRAREVLVVAQMAGALTLLTAAGLTLRSLETLTSVDPGFDAERIAQVSLRLEPTRYRSPGELFAFHDELLARIRDMPGVERAATISMVPFGGGGLCADLAPDGAQPVPGCVQYRTVTPEYFATMGIGMLAGRDFTDQDDRTGPPVAILSASAAALAFPDGEAVGGVIAARGARWQVIAVVDDSRHADLATDAAPTVYLPDRQAPFRLVTAVVRARDPAGVAAALPATVWALDPDMAIRDSGTLTRLVSRSAADQRFRSALFGGAGAVGLFLAMLGVAGLLLQLVQQRRREIGVRMALGSSQGGIVRSVLRRAMVPTAIGSVLGLGTSLVAGRLLRRFLFGVSTGDPATLVAAAVALTGAALVAAVVPARRAAAVDPIHTLREE